MEQELVHLIALSLIPNLNPVMAKELLALSGSASILFDPHYLKNCTELNPAILAQLRKNSFIECAKKELEFTDRFNINVYGINDNLYPYRLKECPDGPLVLYTKGAINFNNEKVLSIVGTRQASPYGRDLTRLLIKDLAELDPQIQIISGLAYGIDIIAHQAAMEFGLKTSCVLGHGLQTVYPIAHSRFADEMAQKGGANISELPWGTESAKWRFLQRNRIVAGLCDACIVVESGTIGGSMKTARMAREYNREVFAFPGRTSDIHSQGCNALISDLTAGMIQNATDVFQKMNWEVQKKKNKQQKLFVDLNVNQLRIFNTIKKSESITIQTLAQHCGWSLQETMTVLMELELEGLIEKRPGGQYRVYLTSSI